LPCISEDEKENEDYSNGGPLNGVSWRDGDEDSEDQNQDCHRHCSVEKDGTATDTLNGEN
jgi:hypothetical protein